MKLDKTWTLHRRSLRSQGSELDIWMGSLGFGWLEGVWIGGLVVGYMWVRSLVAG